MAHGASPRHVRKSKTRPARGGAAGGSEAEGARAKGQGPARDAASQETPVGGAAAGRAGEGGLDAGGVRLQKLLAGAGFGSRREVERFLTEERVTVNGRVAALGDRADPLHDEIRVDGERLARDRPTYWLLNKPRGVVTTVRDDAGRRTVIDLLPRKAGRLFPVGRLDRETSGLLLLTNDGDLAHALLHPSLGNEREYQVQVKGRVNERTIARLERGVSLEEGRTAPARVSDVRFDPETGTTTLGLTLVEGRKRQIRRSLLVLGHPVRRLVRVRMGPLRLGRLATGEARPLRAEERRRLLEHVAALRSGGVPPEPARPQRRATAPAAKRGEAAKSTRPGPAGPAKSAKSAKSARIGKSGSARLAKGAKSGAARPGKSTKSGSPRSAPRKGTARKSGAGGSGGRQRTPRSRKGTRR